MPGVESTSRIGRFPGCLCSVGCSGRRAEVGGVNRAEVVETSWPA
jgi:hypothetical protein